MGMGVYNLNSVFNRIYLHTHKAFIATDAHIHAQVWWPTFYKPTFYFLDSYERGLPSTQITPSAIWVWHQDNIQRKERRMDRKYRQHCIYHLLLCRPSAQTFVLAYHAPTHFAKPLYSSLRGVCNTPQPQYIESQGRARHKL